MDETAAVVGVWALVFCSALAGLALAVVLGPPALAACWRRWKRWRADKHVTAVARPTRHAAPRRRHA
jgi:hypothetical protein